MQAAERYGIKVGQRYNAADGVSKTILTVTDIDSYSQCDDVVVLNSITGEHSRIDCFKLAMVRYSLIEEETLDLPL